MKYCRRSITAYHRIMFILGQSAEQIRNSAELSLLTA